MNAEMLNEYLREKKQDLFGEYSEFVDKFKKVKTADDCYTPDAVYEVVAEWCEKTFNINRADFIRPFSPEKDYRKYDYEGKICVDNPPFSILANIVDTFLKYNVKFFLFAPALTMLNLAKRAGVSFVFVGTNIIYENGANVHTGFITNLFKKPRQYAAGNLTRALLKAQKRGEKAFVNDYPRNLLTANEMTKIARLTDRDFYIEGEFIQVRTLDAQRGTGKAIYGAGVFISDANADKMDAEREYGMRTKERRIYSGDGGYIIDGRGFWKLSEREREIIKRINEREKIDTKESGDKAILREQRIDGGGSGAEIWDRAADNSTLDSERTLEEGEAARKA